MQSSFKHDSLKIHCRAVSESISTWGILIFATYSDDFQVYILRLNLPNFRLLRKIIIFDTMLFLGVAIPPFNFFPLHSLPYCPPPRYYNSMILQQQSQVQNSAT